MVELYLLNRLRRFLSYHFLKILTSNLALSQFFVYGRFEVSATLSQLELCWNWLRVLGTTETPHIDQGVRHHLHAVVSLLDALKPKEQPLEFVLPGKRPLHSIP